MDNLKDLYPILAVGRHRMNSNYAKSFEAIVIATISVLRGLGIRSNMGRMGGFHAIAGTSRLTTVESRNASSLDPSVKVAKFSMQKLAKSLETKIFKEENGPANGQEVVSTTFDSICDLVRMQCWNLLEGMMIRLPSIVIRVLLENQGNADLPLLFSEWFGKGNFQQNIQITSAMIHILIREKMLIEARALMERFIRSCKCLVSASDVFRALISAYSGSYVHVALCMLIKTYAQLNMIEEATEIFQQSSSCTFANDVKFCNMLLKVSSKMQQPDLVIKIFKEMQKRRICPKIYSLNHVGKALHQKSRLPEVYNLICKMHRTGTIHDIVIYNMLSNGIVYKGGRPQAAKRKRGLTHKRSSYVKLMYWHWKVGKSRIGLRSVKKMIQKGFPSPVPVDAKHVIGLGHDDEIHESCNDTYQMMERIFVPNGSQNASNNFITRMHQTGIFSDGNIDNILNDGPIHKGGKLQAENRKKGLTSKSSNVKLMDQYPKDGKSRIDFMLWEEMIQEKSPLPIPLNQKSDVGLRYDDDIHESCSHACRMLEKGNTSTYASKNCIPPMPQTVTVSDGIFDIRLYHGASDKGGKLQAANYKRGLTSKGSGSVKLMDWHRKDVKSRIDLKLFEELIRKDFPPPVPVYQNYVVGLGNGDEIRESYNHAYQMLEKSNSSSYALNNFMPEMHQAGTVTDGIIDNGFDHGATNRRGKLQAAKRKRGSTFKRSGYVKQMYRHLKDGKSKVDFKSFKEMIQKGFPPPASVYKRQNNGLCRDDKLSGSHSLACRGMETDLVHTASTYATLIHKNLQESNIQEAVFLMEKMLAKRILPGSKSYVPLFTQLCTQGKTDTAEDLFHSILNNGLLATISDYNLLIDGYCKEGKMQKALDLQEKLIVMGLSPDIYSFKTLISGLCIQGEMGTAEILLNRLLEMGLSPVVSIYNNLIGGYCHRGEIEAAFRIRDKMSLNGVEPDVDTYNALISGVCL